MQQLTSVEVINKRRAQLSINVWNKWPLTLSVMSLSASSMMSRVKSLMVSSVIELFWRRCLHVRKGDISFYFPWRPTDKFLFSRSRKNTVAITFERWSVQLTLQLFCWIASCQHWIGGQNNRKSGQEKEKKKGMEEGDTIGWYPPPARPFSASTCRYSLTGRNQG